MTAKQWTNIVRTPGMLIRIPLVLLLWACQWAVPRLEWLAENVFKGWDR